MKSMLLSLVIPAAWIFYEMWTERSKTGPSESPADQPDELSLDQRLHAELRRMQEEVATLVFTTKILCGLVSLVLLGLIYIGLKSD